MGAVYHDDVIIQDVTPNGWNSSTSWRSGTLARIEVMAAYALRIWSSLVILVAITPPPNWQDAEKVAVLTRQTPARRECQSNLPPNAQAERPPSPDRVRYRGCLACLLHFFLQSLGDPKLDNRLPRHSKAARLSIQ
jgi:hypothetical protein